MNKNKLSMVVILFAVCTIATSVLADDLTSTSPQITPPTWEEFCETGYENAKVHDDSGVLNVVNVIKAERVKQTYWAKRREAFERSLQICNTITHMDKSACYVNIRSSEKQKNDIYAQERKDLMYIKNPVIRTTKPF